MKAKYFYGTVLIVVIVFFCSVLPTKLQLNSGKRAFYSTQVGFTKSKIGGGWYVVVGNNYSS
jgi:hypothetical protein